MTVGEERPQGLKPGLSFRAHAVRLEVAPFPVCGGQREPSCLGNDPVDCNRRLSALTPAALPLRMTVGEERPQGLKPGLAFRAHAVRLEVAPFPVCGGQREPSCLGNDPVDCNRRLSADVGSLTPAAPPLRMTVGEERPQRLKPGLSFRAHAVRLEVAPFPVCGGQREPSCLGNDPVDCIEGSLPSRRLRRRSG
jgi:hypothetical protein